METRLARSAMKSIDIRAPFEKAYSFVADPLNWPRFSIVNLRSVTPGDDGWFTTITRFGEGRLKLHAAKDFGIFDHTWKDAQACWTIPARVVPNGDGVTVMLTLFQPPNLSDDQFNEAMKGMDLELNTLRKILES
jgi:hypothetical protein